MSTRTNRSILILFVVSLISATNILAQSPKLPEVPTSSNTWQVAQSVGSSKRKLFVVTIDQPRRRQPCRVQSFTSEKLVCSHVIGGPRTYFPQQIVAVVLPGNHGLKLRLLIGINGGLAAAIWGTVALAATCPACALATGVVALALFGAAGAVLIADEQPDRLLYLAPSQRLSGKLASVEAP
jgi:hypothetical protein